jgi:hypothetical protein
MAFGVHALLIAEVITLLHAVSGRLRRAGAGQAAECQPGTGAYCGAMASIDRGPCGCS